MPGIKLPDVYENKPEQERPHRVDVPRRLNQLLHPSGRKVHVASTPEEAERLKRTLSTVSDHEGFDIVIHGSPEHVETLRQVHSHYDSKMTAFREKHGDIYDEFARVHTEMNALSAELLSITSQAIQLDANFSKFGYSAHIRTKNDPSPSQSSNTSLYGDGSNSSSKDLFDAQHNKTSTVKFFVKPICRQYFHKGLIWRTQEAEETASYELFLDLIYVGIIAIAGDSAAEVATGGALLRFATTFIMGWKIWSDVTVFINWFDADDVLRRVSVLFILSCLLGFTTNIVTFAGGTYTAAVAFYLAARFFTALNYMWYAFMIPMVRPALVGNGLIIMIPSSLWIASIHVAEPQRQILIWFAILFDIMGSILFLFIQRGTMLFGHHKDKLKKIFSFYPAVNIEHRIERTGSFVSLVFGYSVVAILYQSRVGFGINDFFGKAILGLIQAFAFNWLYFEIDSFNLHTHAIRRHTISSLLWFTCHLPFILSYVLASAALSRMVLIHDTPNANFHDLASISRVKSAAAITFGQRWFYCSGLGLALLSSNLISLCHVYKPHSPTESRTPQILVKPVRLAIRTAVAVILICLSLATSLNSLTLIATTTGLVVFALSMELYGEMYRCTGTCMVWERRCAYGARCHLSKRDLEENVKNGTVIKVEELRGESGGYDIN